MVQGVKASTVAVPKTNSNVEEKALVLRVCPVTKQRQTPNVDWEVEEKCLF